MGTPNKSECPWQKLDLTIKFSSDSILSHVQECAICFFREFGKELIIRDPAFPRIIRMRHIFHNPYF